MRSTLLCAAAGMPASKAWAARASDFCDRYLWGGAVKAIALVTIALAWLDRMFDEWVINLGFDKVCGGVRQDGFWLARVQNGQVQRYLGILGLGVAVLVLLLIWGIKGA